MTWFDWAKGHVAKWKALQARGYENVVNFTPRACQAIELARNEAVRLHHDFLGTEHLLLGIIKLNRGVSVNVLRKMGINLEELRLEVERRAPARTPNAALYGTPYTPRCKKVIALAQQQAKSLCHTYVGTEHLLLGLLADGDGVAAKALRHFKVNLEQTRKEILIELDPNFAPPDDAQSGKD